MLFHNLLISYQAVFTSKEGYPTLYLYDQLKIIFEKINLRLNLGALTFLIAFNYNECLTEIEDGLNAPYQPCRLAMKILPSKFLNYLLNGKGNNKDTRASSDTTSAGSKGPLFVIPWNPKNTSVHEKYTSIAHKLNPSIDQKTDDVKFQSHQWYVLIPSQIIFIAIFIIFLSH